MPSSAPTPAHTDSPPINTRTTLRVDAPRARRTPISRTRCVTKLPSNAARPAAASTSANTPSGVNRLSTSRVHALARQRSSAKLPTSVSAKSGSISLAMASKRGANLSASPRERTLMPSS